jgi:hypothetical protein
MNMVGIKKSTVKKDSPVADKAPAKKTVKKEGVKTITQFMRRFTKDTPGTLRFEGISAGGEVMKSADADITQLYIQRSSKAMSGDPRYLKITVEVLDKLPED